MHSSLVLLTAVSLALIASMLTCFVCFIRRRRREEEELERRAQLEADEPVNGARTATSRPEYSLQSPSKSVLINNDESYLKTGAGGHLAGLQRQLGGSGAGSPAAAATSPYHTAVSLAASQQAEQAGSGQPEIRSDMTQQINAAIIGSSEAEFQNDFIQVFPMYQIEPQPDKNTTPYLS